MRLEIEAATRGASERIGTQDRVHRTEWRNGFSRGRAFEGDFSDVTQLRRQGRRALSEVIRSVKFAKTLSFFGASGPRSIDFGQFAPMFRLDAARYRNAIS
jgi:hypothetical protein